MPTFLEICCTGKRPGWATRHITRTGGLIQEMRTASRGTARALWKYKNRVDEVERAKGESDSLKVRCFRKGSRACVWVMKLKFGAGEGALSGTAENANHKRVCHHALVICLSVRRGCWLRDGVKAREEG